MNIPQAWVLSLDRTTWEFGDHCYNILTLGVVHEGVAIPILWWLLKKKGNSNSDEPMRFIEALFKIFPSAPIRCLSADREFIGQAWVRYLLLEPSLSFRIRIRPTDKIERHGKALAAKVVFAHLAIGESQQLQGDCRVWGNRVEVEALRLYALRWGIETLFGIFKTRGFCLESTHFTDPERLRPTFCSVDFSSGLVSQDGVMASSASSDSAQETRSSC
jgi:hypothetical protein